MSSRPGPPPDASCPFWKTAPPNLRRRPFSSYFEKGYWVLFRLCLQARKGRFLRTQYPTYLRPPCSRPPPQTPGTMSESASSLVGRSQSLREGAPDTRSTPLSLSSPVKGRIVQYLTKRYSNKGCAEIEYLPWCPDDYSRGQHLRWCPAIALVPRNIISTFPRA